MKQSYCFYLLLLQNTNIIQSSNEAFHLRHTEVFEIKHFADLRCVEVGADSPVDGATPG